jgi:peptide-methionine (S)-S-oxide reductase
MIPTLMAAALLAAPADTSGVARALFAGGPFWALEAAFESLPGVRAAVPGYAGPPDSTLTYAKVIEGGTGHVLAVEVRFDPAKIAYAKLVDRYWRQIDPLAVNRQFGDSGSQFRTVIYYRDSAQKRDAEASLRRLERGGRFRKPIAVALAPAGNFIPAEEAQQDYHARNAGRYQAWLRFSGRQAALDSIWGTGRGVKALPRHSSRRASP